jgi:hypothetical protein
MLLEDDEGAEDDELLEDDEDGEPLLLLPEDDPEDCDWEDGDPALQQLAKA